MKFLSDLRAKPACMCNGFGWLVLRGPVLWASCRVSASQGMGVGVGVGLGLRLASGLGIGRTGLGLAGCDDGIRPGMLVYVLRRHAVSSWRCWSAYDATFVETLYLRLDI